MQVAIVQMNSGADPEQNLEQVNSLLTEVAGNGADLVVLPENFAAMGIGQATRSQLAEEDGSGLIQDGIAEIARRHQLWIVAGTLPIRSSDPQRPYASCCVYDGEGQRVARYDKIHLFDVQLPDGSEAYAESSYTNPGRTPQVVSTPWGRLGLAVCYDLRFPELFRALAAEGMDLLAIPAAFTRPTGQAHWESLLRARAIENQCFVAAAAQTGEHADHRSTWGHSMLIDGWGRILENLGTHTKAACVTIDISATAALRRGFPALEHRRRDIFHS